MTDRHVVLTILRIQNGVLIYLPYQVPSMKPVFVILQAYSSQSVPELVQNAAGCYPLRFGGDWRHLVLVAILTTADLRVGCA